MTRLELFGLRHGRCLGLGWQPVLLGLLMVLVFALPVLAQAAAGGAAAPGLGRPSTHDIMNVVNSVDLRAPLQSPGLSTPLQLIFLLASLTLLPFIFIATTSFIRIVVVLTFFKAALGSQSLIPGNVLVAIAIFLSIYVMAPTWEAMNKAAIVPFLNNRIGQEEALDRASIPLTTFMVRQTNQQELSFFLRLAHAPDPRTPADVPFYVATPAYMISEVSTGFKIGFIVFLPFIVVDLVITNVIMALGMQQLQTQSLAPPFKVMIFSLANGWHLLIEALVRSFH